MKQTEIGKFLEELNTESNGQNQKGFHYAYKGKIDEIGESLVGKIGVNSKGLLGKEVNPKVFYALGVDGAFQIFNRNLNMAVASTISFLDDPVHSKYFPNTVRDEIKNGAPDRNLTSMEAFEYMRKYLDDMVLYTFDVKQTQYEKTPSDEDIAKVEDFIKGYEAVPELSGGYIISTSEENGKSKVKIAEKTEENAQPTNIRKLIRNLDEVIDELSMQPESDKNPELGMLLLKRGELSMMVREAAMEKLGEVQGKEVVEGNVDRIIYNEDKIRLVDSAKKPHNVYAKVRRDEDGKYHSKSIGAEDGLTLITKDGKPAKYTEAISEMYAEKGKEAATTIKEDTDLIGLFAHYKRLVDEAKRKHLIKDVEGGPDLENLAFYGEAMVELSKRIEEVCKDMFRLEPQNGEVKKESNLPEIEIADSLKPKYQKSTQDFIAGLGDTSKAIGKMKEVGNKLEGDIKESKQVEEDLAK